MGCAAPDLAMTPGRYMSNIFTGARTQPAPQKSASASRIFRGSAITPVGSATFGLGEPASFQPSTLMPTTAAKMTRLAFKPSEGMALGIVLLKKGTGSSKAKTVSMQRKMPQPMALARQVAPRAVALAESRRMVAFIIAPCAMRMPIMPKTYRNIVLPSPVNGAPL